MKVFRIIRSYYLVPFLMFMLFVGVSTCGSFVTGEIDLERITVLAWAGPLIALGGSLIIGSLYYFLNEKALPKRKEKTLNREPFTSLMNYGFTLSEEVYTGSFKDHFYQIGYTYRGGPKKTEAILIECFFNPIKEGAFIPEIVYKQLTEKYDADGIIWDQGSVLLFLNYAIKRPTIEELLKEMEKAIVLLKEVGLTPISWKEMEALNTQEIPIESMPTAVIEVKDYRKPWYYRYYPGFLVIMILWLPRTYFLQGDTFIDWKILLGASLTGGIVLAIILSLLLKKYRVKKVDVALGTFFIGIMLSFCILLEMNYQFTDKQIVTYRLKVLGHGSRGGKHPETYVEVHHAGIEKEISFAADAETEKMVFGADSLIIGTEKGIFGFEVAREWELIPK